jgi:hypothetical protein
VRPVHTERLGAVANDGHIWCGERLRSLGLDWDPTVSVIIGSLPEREEYRWKVFEAYLDCGQCEILWTGSFTTPEHGWGEAVNTLLPYARADFVVCGSDDATPRPGWLQACLRRWVAHEQPQARYLENGRPCNVLYDSAANGTQLEWSRFIALPKQAMIDIGPVKPGTYYVDLDYSKRSTEAGWRIVADDGFVFDHLQAPRTWATADRLERDRQLAGWPE